MPPSDAIRPGRPPAADATPSYAPRSRVFTPRTSGSHGVRKVWRQLRREGVAVARCTVERLMRAMGLRGVMRGKTVKTTIQDPAAPCPRDKVNRQFNAASPDRLWVGDFTYVATWQGFVHTAFVIDAYARRIAGQAGQPDGHRRLRAPTSCADFVLDALEQAIHQRRPAKDTGLVAHSDRASQYLAIRYDLGAWPRPASPPAWAQSGTPTTTRWPRP